MGTMTRRHPALAHVYQLQDEERQRRATRPDLSLRHAVVDLVSGCATQYYADHALSEDLQRLDRAHSLLGAEDQHHSGSRFEALSLDTVDQLLAAARPRRGELDDLDAYDELRGLVISVPTRVILGREDDEAPADLLCWNEASCLLEDVTGPYRCASAVSGLAFLGAADRYHFIDPLVDLKRRYEADPQARPELDDEIRNVSATFVEWFGRLHGLV
ncbi:hypothetical protein [Actinomycetospora sp. TBRC 11914]|uniref:hypothetical protein n=1 Tax=Actinomycetospora sp. TBRC 11914 TaxID=2729387 RepID=UPI00145D99B1|nr:hypothetical protein [Actinomycetospora sp. TBRC 11914]NMO93202.1 hypothetical protein [Actinomycetospora sp. TBRC 11914]